MDEDEISYTEKVNFTANYLGSKWFEWSTEEKYQVIRDNIDKINWFMLCYQYQFTEDFLREFKDYIGWRRVLQGDQKYLSKDFLREIKENIDIYCIDWLGPKEDLFEYLDQRIKELE